MSTSFKVFLITGSVVAVIAAGATVGVLALQSWEANRTVDSYAVSYTLTGLKGTEEITYGSAPKDNKAGATQHRTATSRPGTATIDVVVGAGQPAFVTVDDADVSGVTCAMINDRDSEIESRMEPKVARTATSLTCSLTMKTTEKVVK